MSVMGIIFANDVAIGELTSKRTMASLPFGGRYRQVDFHLANLTAGGIRHLGIISRQNYQSLMNHVGSGEEWGLELGQGGLEYLTPFAMSSNATYRGKLENLHSVMDFLQYADDEYVVMSDSAILTNLDIPDVVAKHIASGKDVTVVTKAGIANGVKKLDMALKLDANGEVADIVVDYVAPADYVASIDTFVVSREWLINQVKECVARSLYHLDRDLILGGWKHNVVSVNAYQYDGVALYNESTEEYFANSMALLDKDTAYGIFHANHDIYTKVRDRVPTYYGEGSEVANSLIADGGMIEGTVANSVLFRQVTVAAGAKVEDSIIMNDTVVGEGAELKYVILDKNVTVSAGAKLVGTPKAPIIIKRGETV